MTIDRIEGHEPAPQDDAIGTVMTGLVARLKGAGLYLREKDLGEIADDLTTLIQRYPVPALFIAVGLGYVLSRARGRPRS